MIGDSVENFLFVILSNFSLIFAIFIRSFYKKKDLVFEDGKYKTRIYVMEEKVLGVEEGKGEKIE